jgi:hypothetical protein
MIAGLEPSAAARCASAASVSTTCRRAAATSRWCSRTTRCTRTRPVREHGLRPAPAQDARGRDPAPRRRGPAAAHRAHARAQAARAVGRPAPARGHRPRHRAPAQVFLFDEPLSNLDAQLRNEMRSEIKRLHQRLGATIIYVTHDQVEAMTLADRIAVLRAATRCSTTRPTRSTTARRAVRRRLHRRAADEPGRLPRDEGYALLGGAAPGLAVRWPPARRRRRCTLGRAAGEPHA